MTAVRVPRATLEELLASLRRVQAQLDAAADRLAAAREEPETPPVRTLHRLPEP